MTLDFHNSSFLLILKKVFITTIIFLTFYLFYRIARLLFKILLKRKLLPDAIGKILNPVLTLIIFTIAIFAALQYNGISANSLWAVVSALLAMVAIGFVAVWSVISNVLCTLLLIITRPFRIGDHIEITEPASSDNFLGGKVMNISMLYTTLQEAKGSNVLLIPNNFFFQKAIRRKQGEDTYSIDEQIFKEMSLLYKKK